MAATRTTHSEAGKVEKPKGTITERERKKNTIVLSRAKIASSSLKQTFSALWGLRHTYTLLSFFGYVNMYAMRINMGVAVVAMVKHSEAK